MYSEQDSNLSVLVVDDNEVNALILTKMLNMFNVYTDQTFSGKNAVKLYRKIKYDVVFVDHIMPEMDGVQVTHAIRRLEKEPRKTLIIILTATITNEIREKYKKAGADDIFEKPLKLALLIKLFKKQFPEVSYVLPTERKKPNYLDVNNIYKLRAIIKEVSEINFDLGMKYAFGNPDHFVNILKVSIKDIKYDMSFLNYHYEFKDISNLRIGIHNLKSVLSNIGVTGLLEEVKVWENALSQEKPDINVEQLNDFTKRLGSFKDKLNSSIMKYDLMKSMSEEEDIEVHPLSKDEYEQCIQNTIYYIKCYEYDSIINEIEKLIRTKDVEMKKEFLKALEEVKEFNYDKALVRIMKITEKEKIELT